VLKKTQIREQIFHNGETYFKSLLEDIKSAKHSIDIEVYIFSQDNLGKKIINSLIAAQKKNKIKIRLLVDGAGSPFWGGKIARKLEQYGIKTKVFNPLPWQIWQWRITSTKLPILLSICHMFMKINCRNHRKSIIIDDKIAYIGSLNVDQRHLSQRNGGQNWRDTAVRISGCNLDSIKQAYNKAWEQNIWQSRIEKIVTSMNNKFRLNNNVKRRFQLYRNLLKRMSKAKKRVWITNAYFIPNNLFIKKIMKLSENGIDVRIIVPKISDVAPVQWATTSLYEKLLKSGIKIYEYNASILHAKTIVIDDWIMLGSSNLNHRSLIHDLEVDINIESTSARREILRQFSEDIRNSDEITLATIPYKNLLQRLMGKICVMLRYWS
jgi:cardiolipin synthase